jgi:hypothetical protein
MTDTLRFFQLYARDPGIRVMALIAAAGVTLGAIRSDRPAVWLFLLGWGLYLLEEHLIHRFVFHARAPRRQRLFDLLYRLHYGHHDQVRNPHLLFTPVWFSVPVTAVTIAALSRVLPMIDTLIAILGGSACGYLVFEWLHLTSHVRMAKGRLGRYVTRRHARHHCIDHHHWYTVSPGGQLIDKALGADPVGAAVIPNVRTCGLEPDDPRLVTSRLRFGCDTSLLGTPEPAGRRDSERAA